MRERPVLFSGPMVRAILSGAKTQTRRVIRIDDTPVVNAKPGKLQRGIPTNAVNVRHLGCYLKCDAAPGSDTVSARVPCPYGEIGDRLWVRETWAYLTGNGLRVVYRADGDPPKTSQPLLGRMTWTPSIFLPRAHSRLSLEVTSVRVERVRSISEEDAKAEGVGYAACPCDACESYRHREAFSRLWDSINGKRPGCSWDADPWVWVVGFRRAEAAR